MAKDDRESLETLKLYFEYFKHISTIAGGAALVVVAITTYRGTPLAGLLAVLPLLLLGASLLFSLQGMEVVLRSMAHDDDDEKLHVPLDVVPGGLLPESLSTLFFGATRSFGAGVVSFALLSIFLL